MKNGKIGPKKAIRRPQNSKIPKNSTNVIFQQFLTYLSSTFTIFWYLWFLTTLSGLLWHYFAVFHGITLKCTWGSLLGHNQGWNSKFGNIHLPYCKFRILLSSGLLVAFFGRFSKCNSKMYLGHFYMSQSMLGKQIWKYSLALLQLLDSAIKQPSGGLYGRVI